MSMALYEKILTDAKGSVEFMWLHGYGEPLINKNIYQMINQAEEAGIRAGISTNATLLDETAGQALLDSRLSLLLLCLDGATKETFESIRIGADFEGVTANIVRFAAMRRARRSNLKVSLQMINMTANQTEQRAFLEQWKDAGLDSVQAKDLVVWANYDGGSVQIAPPPPPTPGSLCCDPWVGFIVLADGGVIPCCNDYAATMPLGDLTRQSLAEVWNGEPIRALRRRLRDGQLACDGTLCKGCSYTTASSVEAETGSGPFDPVRRQFGTYLRGGDPMPRLAPTDGHVVDLVITEPEHHLAPKQAFICQIRVRNHLSCGLRSSGSTPVCLSYHWIKADGSYAVYDGERTSLIPELPANAEHVYDLRVIAPPSGGEHILRVTLVQEQVAWFEDWDARNAVDCRINVIEASEATEHPSS
jgi:MoaA/NifB/PqqE/SkfB family radical SAM enzyme